MRVTALKIIKLTFICLFLFILIKFRGKRLFSAPFMSGNVSGGEDLNEENVKFIDKAERKTTGKDKPHIILIVADDLGYNDVPWHNNKVDATNMLQLARKGIILDQSYVQPYCSATRSALLTGKYPFTLGTQGRIFYHMMAEGLTLEKPILPQMLKLEGYGTHLIGKWGLGFCKWAYTPTERGFDTFHGFYGGLLTYYSHTREGGYDFRHNKEIFNASGIHTTDALSSYTENLLRSSDPRNPKFLYVSFQSVNSPRSDPPHNLQQGEEKDLEKKKRDTYMGQIFAMDKAIGRIVKALKDTKHYENSVIIFTSDNGGDTESQGDNFPLKGGKRTLYEGGTRAVSFIHSPLLPRSGFISKNLIHVTDWVPTILDITGSAPIEDTDGVSQWGYLRGLTPAPRNEFVYSIIDREAADGFGWRAAIRHNRYKLIVYEKRFVAFHSNLPHWLGPIIKEINRVVEGDPHKGRKLLQNWWEKKSKKHPKGFVSHYIEKYKELRQKFRNHTSLKDFNSVDEIMKSTAFKIRLFNIDNDPIEKDDLYPGLGDLTTIILKKLFTYKNKIVRLQKPIWKKNESNPINWNGVWTPGWC